MATLMDNDEPKVMDGHVTRSLFKWSGMCIATLDRQQRVVDASAEFLRQFGGTAKSNGGQSFYDLMHSGNRDKIQRQFMRILSGERMTFTETIVGLGPRASVFSAKLTGIASRGDNQQINAIVVIIRPDEPVDRTPASVRDRPLTQLDARILEGVASGASTIQLAGRLHLSRQGVEYRIGSMFRKLKASNRAALVSRAYAIGALTVGSWPPRVHQDFVNN